MGRCDHRHCGGFEGDRTIRELCPFVLFGQRCSRVFRSKLAKAQCTLSRGQGKCLRRRYKGPSFSSQSTSSPTKQKVIKKKIYCLECHQPVGTLHLCTWLMFCPQCSALPELSPSFPSGWTLLATRLTNCNHRPEKYRKVPRMDGVNQWKAINSLKPLAAPRTGIVYNIDDRWVG